VEACSLRYRPLACCAILAVAVMFGSGMAAATAEPTARASVQRHVIHVRHKPFFPLMLIDQCTPGDVARARRLGINLILNEHCSGLSPRRQLTMVQRRLLAVLPIAGRGVRGSGLVGWTYPDEPEGNHWTPASLRRAHPYQRGNGDGLLSFVTTGSGFFREPYRDVRLPLSDYRRFARLADVAGFDLYPLGHCQRDLSVIYESQRAFVRLVGPMPTFQWIETGPIKPTYCGGFQMSPAELRAEVWLAIAGGARGIGFFTHTWSPAHRAFDVTPALQRTMKKLSDFLGAVRPGLVGRTILSGANSGAIKLAARSGDGRTYVFAVNATAAPVTAQLHVPRLRDGRLQVFGEKRSVTGGGDRFVDNFGPLAVHVYVQRPER
jgi:hypothetical protein